MGETDWGGNWVLFWWTGPCPVNPIFCNGQSYVPSLLFDLRSNYVGSNEDNGNLLLKVPCMHHRMQCPQPCSRPLLTHAFARGSWTLTGKSGSVSCGVTALFSWILVNTIFCLCPPRVCFPVLYKFWWLYYGVSLMAESKELKISWWKWKRRVKNLG